MRAKTINNGKTTQARVAHLALCIILTLLPVAMVFFLPCREGLFSFMTTCVMLITIGAWCMYISKYHELSSILFINLSLATGVWATLASLLNTINRINFFKMGFPGWYDTNKFKSAWVTFPRLYSHYSNVIIPMLTCITCLIIVYAVLHMCKGEENEH